jgi:hypothetical protein
MNPWTVLSISFQWFIVGLLGLIMIGILLIIIFALISAAVAGTRSLRRTSTVSILTRREPS